MHLATLRELAASSYNDPNYQYREKTKDEILAMAQVSFLRLPPAQQTKAMLSWTSLLEKNGEPVTTENQEEFLRLRFLCQTNLFFLCHVLEKYNQVTVTTHEDICNKFFTQKNPTYATFEMFANQYTDLKERLLLVPRGGFKSSIDIADSVQWIICFPAVTILILTGVYKLAGDFVGELKQHFTLEEDINAVGKNGKAGFAPRMMLNANTNEWTSSLFQVLFPEHCIQPNDGSQFKFQTPAGGNDKEATVEAASIEQSLVGQHFGVLKLDDVVTNENSQTPDRLSKIIDQISINKAMMHPYGFFDVIGTWYDEHDFYGVTIKQEETFAVEEGLQGNIHGSVESGRFESSVMVKTYLRACWWLTEEAIKAGKTDDIAKKDDLVLWFPERLPYELLKKYEKQDAGKGNFAIKYLNNPRKINKVKIPRELLVGATIKHSELPHQGVIVMAVDTAYSTKSWADYTVAVTALIYGGRFYILNMVRGRFNDIELPAVLAATAAKWKPKRIAIEESVGVKWMGRELKREMDKLQISVPVEYVSLGLGSKANSKKMKAKPFIRLLGDDRLKLLNSCEGYDEILNELTQFTGTSEDKHDDIVSAFSILVDVFEGWAEMGKRVDNTDLSHAADAKSKAMHDMIYGIGKYANLNANAIQNDDNPSTQYQVQNNRLFRDDDGGDRDPLSDAGLFG
jgi:phage terminase large subunit-like protein